MKKLSLLIAATTIATLVGCQSKPVKDIGAADTPEGGLKQTTFFPMAGTENYYAPRPGKSNLVLMKSGQNYYFTDDNGKMIYLYPQGDRYYSPRPGGKTIYCHRSGPNLLCQG